MEKSNIEIRLEKKEEHQKVENLVRESFLGCVSSRMPGADWEIWLFFRHVHLL